MTTHPVGTDFSNFAAPLLNPEKFNFTGFLEGRDPSDPFSNLVGADLSKFTSSTSDIFNFDDFFGTKPAGEAGAATEAEIAFNAASAVNQNDPTFFQSLIDSGRLRLDADLPGGGTGTPFGQAGSAIPNYALESAMGAGDGRGDGRGGLPRGNVNTRNIGGMFPGFDSLTKSVSGFVGDTLSDLMHNVQEHKQRLATEFGASTILSAGMTGPGGLVMGGLVHGVGNVFEADALRNAMGIPERTGFVGTIAETFGDFFGTSDVFDLHDIVDTFEDTKGIAADLGLDRKEIEQLARENPEFLNQVLAAYTGFPDQNLSNRPPFGFDPAAPQTLRPGHFDEPSPMGDPGAYESIEAWGKALTNAFETGQWGGFGDSTQPFDPNATRSRGVLGMGGLRNEDLIDPESSTLAESARAPADPDNRNLTEDEMDRAIELGLLGQWNTDIISQLREIDSSVGPSDRRLDPMHSPSANPFVGRTIGNEAFLRDIAEAANAPIDDASTPPRSAAAERARTGLTSFDVNRDDRHGPTDREREQEREREETARH